MTRFAETLERVCVETVESGQMTKDLAILIGPDQSWMTTEQFFEAIRANLEKAMGRLRSFFHSREREGEFRGERTCSAGGRSRARPPGSAAAPGKR